MSQEKLSSNFEKDLMKKGASENLSSGIFVYIYLFTISGCYKNIFANGDLKNKLLIIIISLVIIILSQFVGAPWTNKLITKDITEKLKKEIKEGLSIQERTDLLLQLIKCPYKVKYEVMGFFGFSALVICFVLFFKFGISKSCFAFILISCGVSTYNVGIMAYKYTEEMCKPNSETLIKKGIYSNIIKEQKIYGITTRLKIFEYAFIPFSSSFLMIILFLVMAFNDGLSNKEISTKITAMMLINSLTAISTIMYVQKSIQTSTNKLFNNLKLISEKNIGTEIMLPVDLSDEESFTFFLINDFIITLQKLNNDISTISSNILNSTNSLSVSAKNTAQTAITEASAVRECFATMENTRQQIKRISIHIEKMKEQADSTKDHVQKGKDLLQQEINKINEITDSNKNTVLGIKALSEKIDSIWKLISSIDAIARKTKTIAFNAELEGNSNGNSIEKFHIIANEIRRLAQTITSATKEINERLSLIQHSSDNLIITSESGSQKSIEENEFLKNLEINFKELSLSSIITADSIGQIKNIIDSQESTFDNIKEILQKINNGFERFSQVSQSLSENSDNLKSISRTLLISNKEEI